MSNWDKLVKFKESPGLNKKFEKIRRHQFRSMTKLGISKASVERSIKGIDSKGNKY